MGRIAATTVKRGENGRVADFVDGLDRDVVRRAAAIARHAPVARNVLHHHDGVVHQDSDGKDQREQRDAVEGVSVEVEDGERQGERHGNREEHDQRFAKAQRDGDEQAHRNHRDEHVQQQFVRFLLRGFAVVPRDGDRDVGWNHAAFERLNAREHVFGNLDGIGPLALRYGDGHGRIELAPGGVTDIFAGLLAAIGHLGDVAHENRLVVNGCYDDVPHVVRGAEKLAGLQQILLIGAGEVAGGQPAVGKAERAGHLQG